MTTHERACRCGHGETAHLHAGRYKDCREPACACIIYTRTSKRLPAADDAPVTIADRAVLAARRHRDRAAATVDRWAAFVAVVDDPWTSDRLADARAALADAERTMAELERGAGVPIAADEDPA